MWKRALLACCAVVAVSGVSQAQVGITPFFFPGSIGYEPVISTLVSGPFLAEQAIVSADRKYVTININAENSGVVILQPYTFTSLPNGFVGQTTPAGAPQARNGAAKVAPHVPTVLDKTGMTFISPLKN